jgi:hypothetical protein
VTAIAAAVAAAVAVGAAADATADVNERSGAPALVEARQQALLIAVLRGLLATAGVVASIARGVHLGPALGLAIFGAALVLLSIYGGGRPARSRARFANPEPAPADAQMQSRWRGLAEAAYPSTIGLTVLTAIALWPQPPLAAFLAGILAGLAVMSLVGFTRLTLLERTRRSRILVDYKASRVFEAPR